MATTAKEMVALLKEALASNIGVKKITVDGQEIQFDDRMAIINELKYWETKAAQIGGRRKMFRSIDLSRL